MSGATTVAYLARRAAQKEKVRILYGCALKDILNWAVHRHLFYQDSSDLREKFEANKHVEDLDTVDKMIAAGEATYNKWRHPDPYIRSALEFQYSGQQPHLMGDLSMRPMATGIASPNLNVF
ncbi:hypothetical protein PVK06_047618 [Gossypium arboreum]|uniref:NADH dehydrogenase [ubiquinone] 1 beta subcomplex subunit 9 n=1 Tax=Gossypium arboreum TaxID=29729 RepID=A0ABR0MDS9_GOSAR|nr:hypothetical protein PVK06_047618 [Gossypium arboreum]